MICPWVASRVGEHWEAAGTGEADEPDPVGSDDHAGLQMRVLRE